MKSNIQICELSFADKQRKKLTIQAQESLKEKLLIQAKDRATCDGLPLNFPRKVHEYYYDELAHFMEDHPDIFIELVLIKLEVCTFDNSNSEALLTL